MEELPTAIREAEIKIGSISIKVYHLDNGQRVLDVDDVHKFFEYLGDGGALLGRYPMPIWRNNHGA
ncbi:hypothetical protein LCGC14_1679680 [marine sediment metagenome]|uniref:Uncharacterized protein n=1 Tax=marine sediment metagenome TaxID=412755 RepID=A0A0F9K4T2_9ZZZZ